jgi:site-specific DNA-methyltransferase (adenine-specific)
VAQRLRRSWIGIDITYLAINLIKRRLGSRFSKVEFTEMGQPTDLGGARHLAELDRFQLQQWALSLIGAVPLKPGAGKGADRGVDGLLYFYEAKDVRQRILVQVKSGGVKRSDVATLLGDVGNQKAVGGILITLDPPTVAMKKEVVEAGRYTSKLWKKRDYPKVQILTIEGLLSGAERPDTPPLEDPFAKAAKADSAEQIGLPTVS